MAANVGRNLKIMKGAEILAGVRSKTITYNGEAIDITSDDDLGYRTLLSDPAQLGFDMSVEGVTKDSTLRSAMLTGTDLMMTDITIEFPNGDTLAGNMYLSSLEETGAYNEAVTFSATMQSSGAYTYTPAVVAP